MTITRETIDWLLKAGLWISAEESLGDSFEALREAKSNIRAREDALLDRDILTQKTIYRLMESVVWSASGNELTELASNMVEIFRSINPDDLKLNGERSALSDKVFDVRVAPTEERSNFWDVRLDSAKNRGASSSFHKLLDFSLKTVEIGLHPLEPDLVNFIVEDFQDERQFSSPDVSFPIKVFHRSAQSTLDSSQFVSINEKVVWVDDSSGRMGVVGGEPLPVIGQPEGTEPALRIDNQGEEFLQPFDSIELLDEVDNDG